MMLITGATGTVGSEVVKQLAASNAKFRVLARDPRKVVGGSHVEVVKGDLSEASALSGALRGINTLFLLTNSTPTSTALQNGVIDAAKGHGVRRVVRLSVINADLNAPMQLARWHAQTDAYLRASGLEWTLLQPAGFMQNTLASAASVRKDGAFYGSAGEGRASTVDARDVASAAVKVLTTNGHAGATYTLTGKEAISYGDIARKLTRTLGRTVKYVNLPPEQFKAGLTSAGVPDWLATDYLAMHALQAQGRVAAIDPALSTLIGKVHTYDEFLDTFGSAFR